MKLGKRETVYDADGNAIAVYQADEDLKDVLEIIQDIDPEMGRDKLIGFFKEWNRSLKKTEFELARGFHFLQMLHALKGYGSDRMDKWIKTQAYLLDGQSRHMSRWVNTKAAETIERKFKSLQEDFKALIEIMKREIVLEDFTRIMEEWRVLRSDREEGEEAEF
jgi:hypothetical protein